MLYSLLDIARARRVAVPQRLDLLHGATQIRVEVVRAKEIGDADETELVELLLSQMGKVDADAAFMVRLDKLADDL